MDAVIFAQILGPVLLAISSLMLLQKHIVIDNIQEVIDHAELRLTASLLPLLLGITILLTAKPVIHSGDYLIYALGIIFLLSGLFRLFFTQVWLRLLFSVGNYSYARAISYILFVYGVMLTYHGFYII